MQELPSMSNTSYASSSLNVYTPTFGGGDFNLEYQAQGTALNKELYKHINFNPIPKKETPMTKKITLRLVRTFIIDADENLPMPRRLLHQDERITDLTDQELFFECNIKAILQTHNVYRSTLIDKEQTKAQGKNIPLEPVRIKDLKMFTVDIFNV